MLLWTKAVFNVALSFGVLPVCAFSVYLTWHILRNFREPPRWVVRIILPFLTATWNLGPGEYEASQQTENRGSEGVPFAVAKRVDKHGRVRRGQNRLGS